MTSKNITTLKVWDTMYNADSVEWCPVAPYQNLFVCGTYQLIENISNESVNTNTSKNEQTKIGFLYLLCFDSQLSLCKLQTLELAGILDSKWCQTRVSDKILLGVVTAKGELLVYELITNNRLHHEADSNLLLQLLAKIQISHGEKNALALSLDWSFQSKEESSNSDVLISVSDSSGNISLLRLENSTLMIEMQWKLHEFEAWITAFDYWTPSIIYSGGDDMKFFVVDSRAGCENPVLVNKSHEMGVTSLHCNKAKEHCLISGSYDESVRFWDTRNLRKPHSTLPLIGGIWRLKWDPNNTQHIIAACMYGGFCIVNGENTSDPKTVAIYKEHKDIAYGCDWSYQSQSDLRNIFSDSEVERDISLFSTCSFYDHKMCLSVFDRNTECNLEEEISAENTDD